MVGHPLLEPVDGLLQCANLCIQVRNYVSKFADFELHGVLCVCDIGFQSLELVPVAKVAEACLLPPRLLRRCGFVLQTTSLGLSYGTQIVRTRHGETSGHAVYQTYTSQSPSVCGHYVYDILVALPITPIKKTKRMAAPAACFSTQVCSHFCQWLDVLTKRHDAESRSAMLHHVEQLMDPIGFTADALVRHCQPVANTPAGILGTPVNQLVRFLKNPSVAPRGVELASYKNITDFEAAWAFYTRASKTEFDHHIDRPEYFRLNEARQPGFTSSYFDQITLENMFSMINWDSVLNRVNTDTTPVDLFWVMRAKLGKVDSQSDELTMRDSKRRKLCEEDSKRLVEQTAQRNAEAERAAVFRRMSESFRSHWNERRVGMRARYVMKRKMDVIRCFLATLQTNDKRITDLRTEMTSDTGVLSGEVSYRGKLKQIFATLLDDVIAFFSVENRTVAAAGVYLTQHDPLPAPELSVQNKEVAQRFAKAVQEYRAPLYRYTWTRRLHDQLHAVSKGIDELFPVPASFDDGFRKVATLTSKMLDLVKESEAHCLGSLTEQKVAVDSDEQKKDTYTHLQRMLQKEAMNVDSVHYLRSVFARVRDLLATSGGVAAASAFLAKEHANPDTERSESNNVHLLDIENKAVLSLELVTTSQAELLTSLNTLHRQVVACRQMWTKQAESTEASAEVKLDCDYELTDKMLLSWDVSLPLLAQLRSVMSELRTVEVFESMTERYRAAMESDAHVGLAIRGKLTAIGNVLGRTDPTEPLAFSRVLLGVERIMNLQRMQEQVQESPIAPYVPKKSAVMVE